MNHLLILSIALSFTMCNTLVASPQVEQARKAIAKSMQNAFSLEAQKKRLMKPGEIFRFKAEFSNGQDIYKGTIMIKGEKRQAKMGTIISWDFANEKDSFWCPYADFLQEGYKTPDDSQELYKNMQHTAIYPISWECFQIKFTPKKPSGHVTVLVTSFLSMHSGIAIHDLQRNEIAAAHGKEIAKKTKDLILKKLGNKTFAGLEARGVEVSSPKNKVRNISYFNEDLAVPVLYQSASSPKLDKLFFELIDKK